MDFRKDLSKWPHAFEKAKKNKFVSASQFEDCGKIGLFMDRNGR